MGTGGSLEEVARDKQTLHFAVVHLMRVRVRERSTQIHRTISREEHWVDVRRSSRTHFFPLQRPTLLLHICSHGLWHQLAGLAPQIRSSIPVLIKIQDPRFPETLLGKSWIHPAIWIQDPRSRISRDSSRKILDPASHLDPRSKIQDFQRLF